jgi:MFS family permease
LRQRLPVPATVVLGLVAITGFGVWFYGYGVLLEPIRQDTGWSEATLSTTYGVSLLGAGALATLAGRLLHRRGSRILYAVGALVVVTSYLATAAAGSPLGFAVAGVVAGSATGALGYYAAVHTVIAQLVPPAERPRAITVNTLWGAFASPIFLPLMAWLVLTLEWRATLRVVGIAVSVAVQLAALLVPASRGPEDEHVRLRAALAAAGRDRVVLALLAPTFAGGLVTSLLLLYQVPAMVAAGLTLTTAASLAGARGFLQLGGRLPMPWLIRRVGSRNTLRLSHFLVAVSCMLLPFSGSVPAAVLFAVVAGFAIGALVPVESIFSADAVPGSSIGMVLGVSSLTRGVGAALGPVLGGALTTAVGTRTPALLLAGVVAFGAVVLVPRLPARHVAPE